MRTSIGALSHFVGRPMVASALAAFIVLVVAAFVGSQLQRHPAVFQSDRTVASVERVAIAPKLGLNVPQTVAQEPAPTAVPANASPDAPQIARTGKLSLFVGNVDKAVSSLSRLAHKQSGDVFSLQVDNADASTKASATMDIRVPANRFDDAMNAVGQVGKVRERSVSAEDLTANITDSSARLRNLRRTESDIRMIMDRSGSIAQVLNAENQLSQVREQIETLESDLKSMRTRVVYSTISISLEEEASSAPVEPTALSQLSSAWRGALHAVSQTTVGLIAALLWLLVFVPYVAVAAAVAFVVYGKMRKRLRAGAT